MCEALADIEDASHDQSDGIDGHRKGRVLGIVFASTFEADEGGSLVTSMHGTMEGRKGGATWLREEVS